MTIALPPLVRKEARALAPIWIAAAGMLALAGVTRGPASSIAALVQLSALLAFVLGAMALGAMSVGHEYAHRTLAQLLSQPGDRGRLFRIKWTVLALFLLALAGVAAVTMFRDLALAAPATFWTWRGALLVSVPLLALCVAPWLTMVCRNPLAGIVFTLAVPTALWLAGETLSAAREDTGREAADALRFTVFWAGVLASSAAALVLGRHTFLRLEARDGHGAAPVIALRRAGAIAREREAGGRRLWAGPISALVSKEIHLQTFTLIAAAAYVAIWATMSLLAPAQAASMLFAVTALYTGLVATLAGAIPSAEERALGTLEWQTLQPRAAWTQWAIKAAAALAITLALAFGLPLLLETLHPRLGDGLFSMFRPASVRFVLGYPVHSLFGPVTVLALLTACGLYLSSLCTGGLRALLLTWPLAACVVVLPPAIDRAATGAAWRILGLQAYVDATQRAFDEGRRVSWIAPDGSWWLTQSAFWLQVGTVGGLLVLLLWLGFLNHRFAERDRPRVVRQFALLALFVVVTAVLQGAVPVIVLRAFAIMP